MRATPRPTVELGASPVQLLEAGSSHTDWSMIAEAGQLDEEAAAAALDQLVRRYWPAVYAYIRRSGRNVHEAADLTQGFVCDVMIARRLCAAADPDRGRFRTLLLSSLRHYLQQERRRENRRRRGGELARPLKLTKAEIESIEDPSHETPEAAFCYQWSAVLVRRVLHTVREGCRANGLDSHWAVFEQRMVRPMLFAQEPTPYAKLVVQLGLKDASQAANMMVTVKRRFVATMYIEVGRTVVDPAQIDDELRQLLRDLERPV